MITFKDMDELAVALKSAADAHHAYENKRNGAHDDNWPQWYAGYLACRYHKATWWQMLDSYVAAIWHWLVIAMHRIAQYWDRSVG